jgi:hypothetical protein
MWLLLDTGFVSIVQHRDDPDLLLVRARVEDDITAVFGPDIAVQERHGADYLYGAVIPRTRVADVLASKVMALDYDSHVKDIAIQRSAPADGRSAAYYDTWSAMAQMQSIPPYH